VAKPSSNPKGNPKIDAYIAKAAPFAQPVLTHLRALVHQACPDVEEDIKWGRPFFLHRGTILCNISAFKQHCAFGFWGAEIGKVLREEAALHDGAMGSLGRITSVKDLPPDKQLLGYIRHAALSPSCQREYVEWIASAKRPETRDRRIAQAVEWIAEGKQRNWKYQGG